MWKDFIRNIVVIFQTTIFRIVGFFIRHLVSDATPPTPKIVKYVSTFFCSQEKVKRRNLAMKTHAQNQDPGQNGQHVAYPVVGVANQEIGNFTNCF